MMKEAHELALLLKQRNNKRFEPLVIGKVVSINPLKVNDGDGILLDDELLITNYVQQLINGLQLVVGNRVCMVTTSDYTKYVVIDKVV